MKKNDSNWQAHLALKFADDGGTTRLVERSHSGPLRVQKPLYPEGARICHAIVLHPPGGVVGGDQLSVHAGVGSGAHALLTTPGAAKWYRANGHVSRQQINLTLEPGARRLFELLAAGGEELTELREGRGLRGGEEKDGECVH